MTASDQKFYAGFLIDTTFIAAVQTKKWGTQQRTGYHILALSSDHSVIDSVANSPTAAAPETIDLSTTLPTKEKGTRNRKPGGKVKVSKQRKRRRISEAGASADAIGDEPDPVISGSPAGNADSDVADNDNVNNQDSDFTPVSGDDSDDSDDSDNSGDDNDDNNNDAQEDNDDDDDESSDDEE